MRLVVRPEAQAWYEARSPGLGFEFVRAVDAAIARMLRLPKAFPQIEDNFRRVVMRRFPYSIIYPLSEAEIVIVSCFHHRRRPSSWSRNLDST
jgi:plasmid stabilization system protein ParE